MEQTQVQHEASVDTKADVSGCDIHGEYLDIETAAAYPYGTAIYFGKS